MPGCQHIRVNATRWKIMKPKIIFIAGPTSSGKTAVAIELAERIEGEIISCDSMQVYRDMDVLTRMPSNERLSHVKHYLVKEFSPEEEFSAAVFVERSEIFIREILERGKVPIFAGGTGLYMKSLIEGLFSSPPKDEELRAELSFIASKKGNEYLHGMLEKIDPESAERLHFNDVKRVMRAIEVFELTGNTINEKRAESKGIKEDYDCRIFALDIPREKLYANVEAGVDKMFNEGLVAEVKRLLGMKISITAGKAIGISEVSAYLKGNMSLDEAKDEMKKNTRHYAKRQMTWLRGMGGVEWINADRPVSEIVDEVIEKVKK